MPHPNTNTQTPTPTHPANDRAANDRAVLTALLSYSQHYARLTRPALPLAEARARYRRGVLRVADLFPPPVLAVGGQRHEFFSPHAAAPPPPAPELQQAPTREQERNYRVFASQEEEERVFEEYHAMRVQLKGRCVGYIGEFEREYGPDVAMRFAEKVCGFLL
jgi:hypothetical protein